MSLQTIDLKLGYRDADVIGDLDLTVPAGKITALIGPNGCGKSTLLKGMARLLRPRAGQVLLDGQAIAQRSTREVARSLSILPQEPEAPDGLTVRQLVSYGRFPHQRMMGWVSPEDGKAIEQALAATGLSEMAGLRVDVLSGGQRQRAWIAMALAQQAGTLLLDEPTTFLDIAHQLEVLNLLESLNRRQGRTIVMVLHDINQAMAFADWIVVLKNGRMVADGPVREVVSAQLLADVFGVRAEIGTNPLSGRPTCTILGLADTARDPRLERDAIPIREAGPQAALAASR